MSETMEQAASEQAATAKAKKAAPEVKTVKMEDGREVNFVGKRRMLKSSTIDAEGGTVATRFDFVDGQTRTLEVSLADGLALKFIGHGVEQKVGDETAGDESVEDMVLHVDAILGRLAKGEWGAERSAGGDGFSGASVVVKALVEATGKDIAWVKDWLEKKLEAGKEAGLTRQKLYASFRAPGSRTAGIIARLEAEKASKSAAINADDALAEMMGGD